MTVRAVEDVVAEIIRMGPSAVGHAITMLRLGPGGAQEYSTHLTKRAQAVDVRLRVHLTTGAEDPRWVMTVERTGPAGMAFDAVFQERSPDLAKLGAKLDTWLARVQAQREARGGAVNDHDVRKRGVVLTIRPFPRHSTARMVQPGEDGGDERERQQGGEGRGGGGQRDRVGSEGGEDGAAGEEDGA